MSESRATPARRHADGSYYTPGWLVDLTVRSALHRLLPSLDTSSRETIFSRLRTALRVRFIDPACGDGAFLVGAAEQWSAALMDRFGPLVNCTRGEPGARLLAAVTRRCVFGVDLDVQAVESARTRLQTFAGRSSKQLARHLRQGDSLLDAPFLEIKFDAVIGNPPYVDSETMARDRPALRNVYAERWTTASGNWDLFVPFVELSLSLARERGQVALVLPNKLLSARYAGRLRRLLRQKRLRGIVDVTSADAFDAGVYPVVLHVENAPEETGDLIEIRNVDKELEPSNVRNVTSAALSVLPIDAWHVLASSELEKMLAIWRKCIPLGSVASVTGAATVAEAYAMRDCVRESSPCDSTSEELKRMVNTGTLARFGHQWGSVAMRYLGNSFTRPVIATDTLRARWPRRWEQACAPKLILGGLCRELRAYFDQRGELLAAKSTLVVRSDHVDLRLLAAILNSRWMTSVYRALFGGLALQGGYLQITTAHVKALPFPTADVLRSEGTLIDEITRLVDALRITADGAKREPIDREIEARVAQLFT